MTIKNQPNNFRLHETILNSPHTLIAGTTGSGKSVLLNGILLNLLKEKPDAGFVLIDTKRVELRAFKDAPNCIYRAVEREEAEYALDMMTVGMETRFEKMEESNLKESDEFHIFIVIDELADLLSAKDEISKSCLESIVRLGRLGRAAHMHLLCCTQDPSRSTLTAQLMQNFTTCIALRCKSDIESKQIIGIAGAEELPRHGKAILSDSFGYTYVNIPFTTDEDVNAVVSQFPIKEAPENKESEPLMDEPPVAEYRPAPVANEVSTKFSVFDFMGKALGYTVAASVVLLAFCGSIWLGLGALGIACVFKHAMR